MLNATDETANPYGLILSKIERETIYGDLTRSGQGPATHRIQLGKGNKPARYSSLPSTVQATIPIGNHQIRCQGLAPRYSTSPTPNICQIHTQAAEVKRPHVPSRLRHLQ